MNIELLAKRSYTPYSGRPEAAVAESRSGSFFPGVRIENISFPLTISSAQAALFTCLSEGEQPKNLYTGRTEDPGLHYWEKELDIKLEEPDPVKDTPFKEITLDGEISGLLRSLGKQAVSSHSGLPVSAILETAEGLISGVNIESSSWDSGICAERVAIAKALSYGITDLQTLHLYIPFGEYCSPCGACRQVILEHLPRRPVFLHHADKTVSRFHSSDLLPYSLKSEYLLNGPSTDDGRPA